MFSFILQPVVVALLHFVDSTAVGGEDVLEPCRRLIHRRAMFLGELEPLFAAHDDPEDLLHSECAQTPLQKRVLGCVREYFSTKEQGGTERVLRLKENPERLLSVLKRVVQRTERAFAEKEAQSRLRDVAHRLASAVYESCGKDAGRALGVLDEKFGAESEAFAQCVGSSVSSSMDFLISVIGQPGAGGSLKFAERLRDISLDMVAEYAAVVCSLCRLSWGEARSFDSADITLTRPGFGVIVLFRPDQPVHRIRDLLQSNFLLKTRDSLAHMTVFQVFLGFDRKSYDPKSLPVNLLEVFQTHMRDALKDLYDEVDRKVSSQSVKLSGAWLVLGRDYPSHLTAEVEYRSLSETLQRLKERANTLGYAWMLAMHDELRSRGLRAHMQRRDVGAMLESSGWSLVIGYTSNKDYKTHVTLGIFRTGHQEYDSLLVRAYGDVEREIDPVFSQEGGDPSTNSMMVELGTLLPSATAFLLSRMDPDRLSAYPQLKLQVERAKRGDAPDFSSEVRSEWFRHRNEGARSMFGTMDLYRMGRSIGVSGLHGSTINMNRMQNFEPVASPATEQPGTAGGHH